MGKWDLAARLVRRAIIEEDNGRHDDASLTRLHIDLLIGRVLMSGRWYGGREMVADVRRALGGMSRGSTLPSTEPSLTEREPEVLVSESFAALEREPRDGDAEISLRGMTLESLLARIETGERETIRPGAPEKSYLSFRLSLPTKS